MLGADQAVFSHQARLGACSFAEPGFAVGRVWWSAGAGPRAGWGWVVVFFVLVGSVGTQTSGFVVGQCVFAVQGAGVDPYSGYRGYGRPAVAHGPCLGYACG